jgi:hypothetical protein
VSGPASLALAGPASVADPSSLALHLDICRLHAELRVLEARIAELDSGSAAEGDSVAPFADRAEELVERMVSSLLLSGREEIAADSARRIRQAEDRLHEAARRADATVGAARTEVAAALAERERRLAGVRASGLDVLVLTDDELRAAATKLLPPPTDPMPVSAPFPAPVTAPRMVSSGVAAPAEDVHASTGSMEMEAVEVPAPEPTIQLSPPVSAVAAEEARTDAAFDVWMAVAPATESEAEAERETSTPQEAPEPVVAGDETRSRTRSRWVLPLEVAAALLVAAILVLVLLVVIG